jgi:hypothetical protein
MAKDRSYRDQIHPFLDQTCREIVPQKMEMEVNPGPLLNLIEGPSHEIRLLAVRNIEDKDVLFWLPAAASWDKGRTRSRPASP